MASYNIEDMPELLSEKSSSELAEFFDANDELQVTPLPLQEEVTTPLEPPSEQLFESIDKAMDFLYNFSKSRGYAVKKRRSKKGKNGLVKAVFLQCDRGGKY